MPYGNENEENILKTENGTSIKLNDSVVQKIEIHHHEGPEREYCPVCNLQISGCDSTFKCPSCGKSPIHNSCRDEEYNLCKTCSSTLRIEDSFREKASEWMLRAEGPNERISIFITPKKTIQLGRSAKDDLCQIASHGRIGVYPQSTAPKFNDIITRVFDNLGSGAVRDKTLLISRIHGSLSIRKEPGGIECLHYCDIGSDGSGSSNGTWMGGSRMPSKQWIPLLDDTALTLGMGKNFEKGLLLTIRVFRVEGDSSKIDAVLIDRGDALAGRQRYLMVTGTAYAGWGQRVPISLSNDANVVWGGFSFMGGSIVFKPTNGSPLRVDAGGSDFCDLRDGMVISGGAFKIVVRCADDRYFLKPSLQ